MAFTGLIVWPVLSTQTLPHGAVGTCQPLLLSSIICPANIPVEGNNIQSASSSRVSASGTSSLEACVWESV
ncbi:hypothetical protein GY45DRAFT_601147 [Cubamyces sp. BRFM 1775]|nr:hypothetical protein GY45DRAFT_601147 [Cubamyces sp. BRFM 1775]